MATTRAFKSLASLRSSFDSPFEEEAAASSTDDFEVPARPLQRIHPVEQLESQPVAAALTPVTQRIDRRRLRKVLKTPSVSLSVAVRSELHEEISAMLFARKTTWIALLDKLLTEYVSEAKATRHFPK